MEGMGTERILRIAAARRHAQGGTGRIIRKAALLTTGEVAEAVGVTVGTVQNWEAGKTVPRGEAGVKWAALLEELQRVTAETKLAA